MTSSPSISVHPAVPLKDDQKVQGLLAFARKFQKEFPVDGETPTVTMEPEANSDDVFALRLSVVCPTEDAAAARAKDLQAFAEQHYPYHTASQVTEGL